MKRNNTITSFMLSLILCLSLSCKGKEKDNKGLILGLLVLSNNSKTASSSATFTISGTITGLYWFSKTIAFFLADRLNSIESKQNKCAKTFENEYNRIWTRTD